jgi:toluene monooxygenase system protein B
MAALPIQGLFVGDFVVHLVLIDTDDTISEVAGKIAHHSVGRRIPVQDSPMIVRYNDVVLDSSHTVVEAGIGPMQVVEVSYG